MKRALVLLAAMNNKAPSTTTLTEAGKKLPINLKAYNAPARHGTEAYTEFNSDKCFTKHNHPELHHVRRSFCLDTINRAFPHSENSCKCKEAAQGESIMGVVPFPSSPTYS